MTQEQPTVAAENKPPNRTWIWEGIKISFPLVTAAFTAVFGFIIWNSQNQIQKDFEQNKLLLQGQIQKQQTQLQAQLESEQAQLRAQLALKEEFYKRRLTIYENTCNQIADTESSLADLGATDEDTLRATNLVNSLYKITKGNRLYWSQQLEGDLESLWLLGLCKLKSEPCTLASGQVVNLEALPQEISKTVFNLHEHMKKDLDISELAKAMREAK